MDSGDGDAKKMNRFRVGLALLFISIFLGALAVYTFALGGSEQLQNTPHNLFAGAPGPVKVTEHTLTDVCGFCHTPYSPNPDGGPLWNRNFSNVTYTVYSSQSLDSSPGQPDGYSKECLSCHDGTIPLNQLLNSPLAGLNDSGSYDFNGTAGPGNTMPEGDGNLTGDTRLIGTDLSNDHPISFVFDSSVYSGDGELADPSSLAHGRAPMGSVKLDPKGELQCISCHNPHNNSYSKFLRSYKLNASGSQICLHCHAKDPGGEEGWALSVHAGSKAVVAPALLAQPTFPSPVSGENEVGQFHCLSCHDPHTEQGAERLLREGADINQSSAVEETCFQCHQSYGPDTFAPDILGQFTKDVDFGEGGTGSAMDLHLNPGDHEPVFTSTGAENALLTTKHVECVDCHNPHQATSSNVFEGMKGISMKGLTVSDNSSNNISELEICLRCHGDSVSSVFSGEVYPSDTGLRPPGMSNKRIEFNTSNSAYHPVAGPGRNPSKSLCEQLSSAFSLDCSDPAAALAGIEITCSDCHNNDFYSGPSYRGNVSKYPSTLDQPKGPHGSNNSRILRGFYNTSLLIPGGWNDSNFELCFDCHDETMLTARSWSEGARTNFYYQYPPWGNLHWMHLINRSGTAKAGCSNCHYNVHSNQEAQNTQYNTAPMMGCLNGPPKNIPTHLVDFSPDINPFPGYSKPMWWIDLNSRMRTCYLNCHGYDMPFTYWPPAGYDAHPGGESIIAECP